MNKTNKYIFSIGLFILLFAGVQAQDKHIVRQTLSSCGGSFSSELNSNSILVQQSIGQSSVIGTFTNGKATVRQGFIQPDKYGSAAIKDPVELTATCFPNPFTNEFTVNFNEKLEGTIHFQLFDLSGRLITQNNQGGSDRIQLDYSSIDSGLYLLIIQNGSRNTTLKIQKQ